MQRMGNWKTRVMVDRYAHLADESLRAGAATVAKLVSSKAKKATQKKKAPAYERRTLASKVSRTTHDTVPKMPVITTT